jgi:hypothetical protein
MLNVIMANVMWGGVLNNTYIVPKPFLMVPTN